MKNKILTDEGFTADEVPKIRRHDILFNKGSERTEAETEEMFALVEELGL